MSVWLPCCRCVQHDSIRLEMPNGLQHHSLQPERSQHTACICSNDTDAPREEPFEQIPQESNAESDSQHTQLLARLVLALLGVQRLDQSTSCRLQ